MAVVVRARLRVRVDLHRAFTGHQQFKPLHVADLVRRGRGLLPAHNFVARPRVRAEVMAAARFCG